MTALNAHFDPNYSEVYARCNSQQHNQLPGESLSGCVAVPKKLSADCNFGVTATVAAPTVEAAASGGDPAVPFRHVETSVSPRSTMLLLDLMLHDRFVYGINDRMLQHRLFAEHELAF